MTQPRKTRKLIAVLALIAERSPEGICGSEMMSELHLWSGTVYPILMRMADAGWVWSEWEKGDPVEIGRPLRRFYKVTPLGLDVLVDLPHAAVAQPFARGEVQV